MLIFFFHFISAKLVRLFEFVTLEHNHLPDQFKPLDDPVDKKNSLKILHNIKHIKDKIYEATCPYDVEKRCVFKFDSSFDKNGKFNSNSTLTMLSTTQRRALYR